MDGKHNGSKRKSASNASPSRPAKIHRTRNQDKLDQKMHDASDEDAELVADEYSSEEEAEAQGRQNMLMDDKAWQVC